MSYSIGLVVLSVMFATYLGAVIVHNTRRELPNKSARALAKATAETEKAYWEFIAKRAKLQNMVTDASDSVSEARKVLDRRVAPML